MDLRQRLADAPADPIRPAAPPPDTHRPEDDAARDAYNRHKQRAHQQLLERIDLDAMSRMPDAQLRADLRVLIERLLSEGDMALNAAERQAMVRDIEDEVLGLGPLEPLMADPTVSDILVNTWRQTYVERDGRLTLTDVRFADNAHLLKIIDKIVSRVGRRVDESTPMVDARLPDGSRVNAIIPPLALDGPLLSIRRFAVVPLTMPDLVRLGAVTEPMAQLLGAMVRAHLNILISGGTGSGKTTLLNVLSAHIPTHERIVTIEDAAELQLQQPHVVRLETRPPNIEGKGEITQRALVKNSLRMRPDRIVLGEVRGGEILDVLQAMNSGHEGSMTTVHANSPRDALTRLENMMSMAGMQMPPRTARAQIASAISVVVQVARLSDGQRKLVSLHEITGMEGDIVTMQEIFCYRQTGIGPDGRVRGHFAATGIRPRCTDRLRAYGLELPDDIFDPTALLS